MFKQITSLNGDEVYLITSLWIFILFFTLIGVMLFFMKKDHIQYMKDIPLDKSERESKCSTEDNLKL